MLLQVWVLINLKINHSCRSAVKGSITPLVLLFVIIILRLSLIFALAHLICPLARRPACSQPYIYRPLTFLHFRVLLWIPYNQAQSASRYVRWCLRESLSNSKTQKIIASTPYFEFVHIPCHCLNRRPSVISSGKNHKKNFFLTSTFFCLALETPPSSEIICTHCCLSFKRVKQFVRSLHKDFIRRIHLPEASLQDLLETFFICSLITHLKSIL